MAVSADDVRVRIPGWGVDLDPAVRPAVPRELPPGPTAEVPRQVPQWPRERSIEYPDLTPLFGTTCPPKGVSGAVRRFAYARFSEGRAAHWLLLLAADRIDAFGAHMRSMATLRPDNPITETGVLAELRHHPVTSRKGPRTSRIHQPLDPVIVAGPWVAGAAGIALGVRRLRRWRTAA